MNFGLDFYEVESYIVSEWLGDLSLKLNLRAQWITSIAHKWQLCTSMPPSSYNTKNVTVCANAELFCYNSCQLTTAQSKTCFQSRKI